MENKAETLFERARREGFSIGAFNAANLETIKAIVGAAKELRSPVMIEASDGEVRYIGKKQLVVLVRTFEQEAGIPILLNLDHAPTKESVLEAIEAGFDYVHFDGSKLPYDENVRITKELALRAHEKGILIEGEMDAITGSSEDHTKEQITGYQDEGLYTDPEKAKAFVDATNVDTFASFVGNAHGLYQGEKHIDLVRLHAVRLTLSACFLSLHGGSGIPDEDIREAIKLGIVKINVNSELRVAYRKALEEALASTDAVAIYRLMPPVIEEVQRVVEEKIRLFNSSGKVIDENANGIQDVMHWQHQIRRQEDQHRS